MKRIENSEAIIISNLADAFLTLKSKKECEAFLRDLCTLSELSSMNERLEAAKKIKNKEPYREIAKQTGASTATITRVAHWLHHGMGGYGLVLSRLHKTSSEV